MLNVVLLTMDNPWPGPVIHSLAERHRLLAIVSPARIARRARLTAWLRRGTALQRVARSMNVPLWLARDRRDPRILSRLQAVRPDVACIAGYPWIIDAAMYDAPRLGTINLHPSLLPRHRGPLPWFWVYYHDDRETGATVHQVAATADAGPILSQQAFSLQRGFDVAALQRDTMERGALMMADCLDRLEGGTCEPQPQNETEATTAPMVKPGVPMVPFETWGVERVWHFLAGLANRYRESLSDEAGQPITYDAVTGFERCRPVHPVGTVHVCPDGFELACRDGIVRLTHSAAAAS